MSRLSFKTKSARMRPYTLDNAISHMKNLPFDFVTNIKLIYGKSGEGWLDNLEDRVAQIAKIWNLQDLASYPDLSYNYVARGTQGGVPIVLKLGCNANDINHEHAALEAFKNHGVVELLNVDTSRGALLLRRAIPGQTLTTLFPKDDLAALQICADLVVDLHRAHIPSQSKFVRLEEWLTIIDSEWDLPVSQLQLARTIRTRLLKDSKGDVLLHGDVHYANVLSDNERWLIIDPKGVIGDPLYDLTGALLREPFTEMMQSSNMEDILMRRIEFMADFAKVSRGLIWEWTFVQTVMSICWSLEDNQNIEQKMRFLNKLQALKVE